MTDELNTKKTPLWLPDGSIRAIIALILTILIAYLAVVGLLESDKILTLLSVVVGFYFGTKRG